MKPSLALQKHRVALRLLTAQFGVGAPRVFGSVLTGTDTEESDLDLLVEPNESTTLLTIAALQNEAEKLLGVPVDVHTPGSLPRRARQQLLSQALPL